MEFHERQGVTITEGEGKDEIERCLLSLVTSIALYSILICVIRFYLCLCVFAYCLCVFCVFVFDFFHTEIDN